MAHARRFVLEYALASSWISWGCEPESFLGYSLGELTAASVAGLIGFDEALDLVIRHAELVDALPQGRMLAVCMRADEVAALNFPEIYLVSETSPYTSIIAGSVPAVGQFQAYLHSQNVASQQLSAKHAFHTPLMEPARTAITTLAANVPFEHAAVGAIFSSCRGRQVTACELRAPDFWANQLCLPVQFSRAYGQMIDAGYNIFVEVGPGNTLTLAASGYPLPAEKRATIVASSPASHDDRPPIVQLLNSVGRAWCAGAPINDLPRFSSADRPLARPAADVSDVALTERVCAVWRALFKKPAIQSHDNFFDLGGDSLAAARMAMRLRAEFELEVTLRTIYRNPSPSELAATIGAALTSGTGAADATPAYLSLEDGLSVRIQTEAEARYFFHSIFLEHCYLRHRISLAAVPTVIDVGANIGLFAIFVCRQRNRARVFSLEPAPPLFEILAENLDAHCPNATAINAGVAELAGRLPLAFLSGQFRHVDIRAGSQRGSGRIGSRHRNQAMMGSPAPAVAAAAGEIAAARLRQTTYECAVTTISAVIDEYALLHSAKLPH